VATETRIDPRAVIDPRAEIGSDVVIGPYCVIGPDVRIEDGCRLASQVSVQGPTHIGPRTRIAPMASIGGPPQDLKFRGERSWLIIGADNDIREFATLNRGTAGGGYKTTIGDGNLLMAYIHIGHDSHVGNHTIFANGASLAGHVEVGDYATIGAFSAVHQFCRVAKHAFIGGYSSVPKDVLPWVLTVGNRAKSYGLNYVGLKRKGYPPETIAALKHCYNRLFKSRLLLAEALDEVEREMGHVEEVRYFIDFVRSSERGVCR